MSLDNPNPTLTCLLLELADYFTRVREPSCVELGKHRPVIDDNIKDAITPWHQLCLHTKGLT